MNPHSAVFNHRESDHASKRLVVLAEKIILWTSVVGLIIAVTTQYIRMKDAADDSPKLADRVMVIEKVQAVQLAVDAERWGRVETWMKRIDRKIDRRDLEDEHPIP